MPLQETFRRFIGIQGPSEPIKETAPVRQPEVPQAKEVAKPVDPEAKLRAKRRDTITNEALYLAIATSPIVHFQSSVDPERAVAEELTDAALYVPQRDVIICDAAGRAYYADTGNDVVVARKGSRRSLEDPKKKIPTGGAVSAETIDEILRLIKEYPRPAIFDLPFLHLTLADPQQKITLIPVLQRLYFQIKDQNTTVVIRTPLGETMPPELQGLIMTVSEKPLTKQEIARHVTRVQAATKLVIPAETRTQVEQALTGLNQTGVERALQYSIAAHAAFDSEITVQRIGEFKEAQMRATGHYDVLDTRHITQIIGWEKWDDMFARYKKFGSFEPNSSVPISFVIWVGMAGTGKTTKAAEIARELKRSGYLARTDQWMGMYHSQTERGFAAALQEIEASAPNVVLFDEIQRIFGGVASDQQTSGGVMNRSFGILLNKLQEWQSNGNQTLIIGTANTLNGLPPELLRRAKVLGVPLPGPRTRLAIWDAKLRSLQRKEAKKGNRIVLSPDVTKEDIVGITIRYSGDSIEKLIQGAAVYGDRVISWRSLVEARNDIPRQEDLDPVEVQKREAALARYPLVTTDIAEPVGTEYVRGAKVEDDVHRPDPQTIEVLPPMLGGRSAIVRGQITPGERRPDLRGPIRLNLDDE